MRFVTAVLVALAAGCSGDSFTGPGDAGFDGAPDVIQPDVAQPDVEASVKTCRWDQPFGTPTSVSELDTPVLETAARLSSDELTISFARNAGTIDLYRATRTDRTKPFSTPVLFDGLNSAASDGFAALSPDGLTAIFNSDRAGGPGSFDLWVATRATTVASFANAQPVAGVNSTTVDAHPYLPPDGSELFYFSDRAGNDNLYSAVKSAGTFGAPQAIAALNTNALEFAPVVSDDRTTIWFGSNRSGSALFDIWVAHRTTTSDGFGTPMLATGLNSTADEYPTWISGDGCRIYFTSMRTDPLGDIYLAAKTPN